MLIDMNKISSYNIKIWYMINMYNIPIYEYMLYCAMRKLNTVSVMFLSLLRLYINIGSRIIKHYYHTRRL